MQSQPSIQGRLVGLGTAASQCRPVVLTPGGTCRVARHLDAGVDGWRCIGRFHIDHNQVYKQHDKYRQSDLQPHRQQWSRLIRLLCTTPGPGTTHLLRVRKLVASLLTPGHHLKRRIFSTSTHLITHNINGSCNIYLSKVSLKLQQI